MVVARLEGETRECGMRSGGEETMVVKFQRKVKKSRGRGRHRERERWWVGGVVASRRGEARAAVVVLAADGGGLGCGDGEKKAEGEGEKRNRGRGKRRGREAQRGKAVAGEVGATVVLVSAGEEVGLLLGLAGLSEGE